MLSLERWCQNWDELYDIQLAPGNCLGWEGNPQPHIYTWWQESLHDIMFITRGYQILLGKVSEKSSSNQYWNNQGFPLSFLINFLLNFPSGKRQRDSVCYLFLFSNYFLSYLTRSIFDCVPDSLWWLFSHSVVSDSLQPHGPQHARFPVLH